MRKIAERISFRSISKCLAGAALVTAINACVTPPPPYEDYTIARSAVRAAQDVESGRITPGLWSKAEDNYRSGEKAYREFEFQDAKKYFKRATMFAEQAENITRLKKFESGDSFP